MNSNLDNLSDHQAEEYQRQKILFFLQPAKTQLFFELQGKQLAEALLENRRQVRFNLPDMLLCMLENVDQPVLVTIPQDQRNHKIGNLINSLRKEQLYKQLRHVLNELEQTPDRAVSVAASLIRYATVLHMLNHHLPSRLESRDQQASKDERVVSVPESDPLENSSRLITSSGVTGEAGQITNQSSLPASDFHYAQRFYVPQWISFGEKSELLANSLEEADAHIRLMQSFMEVLFKAVAFAPYISADAEYTNKRYGMLEQLVNQGRSMAIYQTKEIITHIKERAESGNLNRGLHLSMPYFDDQDLKIFYSNFEIIPAGRIMFTPAFVVRAVSQEQVKVSQDTRYNPSTRKHYLDLLNLLETAFESER